MSDNPAEAPAAMPAARRRRILAMANGRGWILFAGCVLIVAVLRWAEAVVVPIALAILLTFMLNGPVTYLQRWVRRSIAVGLVVLLTLAAVASVGWVLAYQLTSLAEELPQYRQNIRDKIADVRGAGESQWMDRLQSTVEEIQQEMDEGREGEKPTPVVVAADEAAAWGLPTWTGWLMAPAGMLAVVFVLVTFMLLEYADLRDRLLAVVGYGYLANTTRAFDEAASRLSRYLAMQLLINATYGVLATIGLWAIGVPYAMLWGVLGGLLRFVPYVGPWIGASAPVLMSLAFFPGWVGPLWTIGLMVGLELFTNLVLETLLYAGAAGVSQVALLIAITFWTWLWGPIGLLLGMPLTVCLVVLARHVPALGVFRVLMTDAPALTPAQSYYQRVLAGHRQEAESLLETYLKTNPPESAYDDVLLPALTYARRDRRDRRITREAEWTVADVTQRFFTTIDEASRRREEEAARAAAPPEAVQVAAAGEGEASAAAPARDQPAAPLRVLGYPSHGPAGEVALRMLAELCQGLPIQLDVVAPQLLVSEVLDTVQRGGYQVLCIADLPPYALAKVRHVLGRIRQAAPDVRVVIGRWSPPESVEDLRAFLMDAGATEVSTTLAGTRNQLRTLLTMAHAAGHQPARGAA